MNNLLAIKKVQRLDDGYFSYFFKNCVQAFIWHSNNSKNLLAQATNGKLETSVNFKFDHVREISIAVTEEMVEHCTEGALSIEVYGHRSATGINHARVVYFIILKNVKLKKLLG